MGNRSFKIGIVSDNVLLKKVAFSKNVQNVITIGRNQNCDIQINNSHISGIHAQLIHNVNNELYIVDLGSTNGTFINDLRIKANVPYLLNTSDLINFSKSGGVYITFNPDNFKKGDIKPTIDQGNDILGSTNILEKLNSKSKIIIGRSTDCDVVLPNQKSISRQHASIEKKGDVIILSDLGSLNGTYLNGKRVVGSTKMTLDDKIYIGKIIIRLKGKATNLSDEVTIKTQHVSKRFSNGKVGLHECSFAIPSKSLTAVMGPSGCGKSTLLKALNGDSPPSTGRVLIAGLDLITNYDYLKTQIGYVPQDDIVHRQLTVKQSIKFAAKLRLDNASSTEVEQKVEQVIKQLKITKIKDSLVGEISGGQRKRVSIAVEILTDPLILFLDEPTSPLDPQTIKEFLEILRDLANNGTTVLMVTHKPEDLNYMDQVIFMAEGGYLVLQEKSNNYLQYFNANNTIEVYSELAEPYARKWIDKRPIHSGGGNLVSSNFNSKKKTNFISQFWWLTIRYFNIKLNDKLNTAIMIGQAPIIAILVCIIFNQVSQAVPFLMAVTAIWFGTNNAAREIVGESPIYKRERMFNQGIFAYIFSKLVVLSSFAAIQSMLFTLIIYFRFQNGDPSWNDPLISFSWMLMLSISATLMGLLLSATVSTTEKVMTLVPIALIPQIMLAGIIAKINSSFVEILSYFTLSRWGTEGFTSIQGKISTPNMVVDENTIKFNDKGELNKEDIEVVQEGYKEIDAIPELTKNFHKTYDDIFDNMTGKLELDILVIIFLSLVFFIATYIALKRKDSIKI